MVLVLLVSWARSLSENNFNKEGINYVLKANFWHNPHKFVKVTHNWLSLIFLTLSSSIILFLHCSRKTLRHSSSAVQRLYGTPFNTQRIYYVLHSERFNLCGVQYAALYLNHMYQPIHSYCRLAPGANVYTLCFLWSWEAAEFDPPFVFIVTLKFIPSTRCMSYPRHQSPETWLEKESLAGSLLLVERLGSTKQYFFRSCFE